MSKSGALRFQILRRRNSGAHGDGANAVFARGEHILRGIADQRNRWRYRRHQTFAPRLLDGKARQPAARRRHFAESAEAEVIDRSPARSSFRQPMRVRLPVTSASAVPRARRWSSSGTTPGHNLSRRSGTPVLINVLRRFDDGAACPSAIRRSSIPPRAHHLRQDIRIEHAVNRYAVGGCFDAGDLPDGVHQRLTMMRAGAAHQRSIDIEQDQIRH